MSNITVTIATPYLTVGEFAKQTGLTERAVVERCKRGQLPVMNEVRQKGSKFLINNALLIKQALEAEW